MKQTSKLPRLHHAGLAGLLALVMAIIGAACGNASVASSASSSGAALHVTTSSVGTVPNGFLGLSTEYTGLEKLDGNSTTVNQPFVQLMENLNPGGSPVLRIGGDSTDWSWWPVSGVRKPGGVRITLTARMLASAKALIEALHGHYIFGIQFEADNRRIAAAEAGAILSHVGRSNIAALELGNEPELYHAFSWYRTASGQPVFGRGANYTPAVYNRDFANIASGLPKFPIAGPSSGGTEWLNALGSFVRSEPRVKLVTVHAYPTKKCGKTLVKATQFFTYASLQGLANAIGGYVRIAHSRAKALRVDEMNAISCGGQGNLSPAFAPALWAVDFLPRVVRTGAQGVNFHDVPGEWQGLINARHTSSGWKVSVEPEYYGLMMFAQAAPTGAHLLHIAGRAISGIDVWAARTPSGRINVIVVNKTGRTRTIKLGVDGSKDAPGTIIRLRSRGLYAKAATLGGQTISAAGTLTGRSGASTVKPIGGAYPVLAPSYSATELSFGS
ncbi:MAG TPA: hypothetical protein VFP55_08850 [Solirubrobacteraceae bacterium]|nr:hypothetical protein [Solirubrobacteraceae bacterium]